MPEKPKTLAEFTLPRLALNRAQWGRQGRYNVARLIEKHGAEMHIRDIIGQSCHRWTHPIERQRCGLGCDDLVYMFMAKPAADGYAESVQEQLTTQ
ncbi:hypothetical protein CO661_11855 [Sinorhizobium fredii]|uniref:Uncharacterized protein n=1 Tax=Rhizobium fredii TaxID=380 RepID=A0A2A6LYV6_RHIFR|nr:hypothetical protein [Sinorhizobium fredii]PDT47432.1 hypothetical protein CO661_11855 [Sinorhizobium fredii]